MRGIVISLLSLIVPTVVLAQGRPHFDATNPDVHDPVMARGEDGRYYIFSTGMGISVMSSADLKTWQQEKPVFMPDFKQMPPMPPTDAQVAPPSGQGTPPPPREPMGGKPEWAVDSVKGFHGHIWAPDIQKRGDKWYLYYSCSTFGKNGSAIGVATNKTLDPKSADYKWEDQGCVIVSHKHQDNWNAIDPNLAPSCESAGGAEQCSRAASNPTLVYGSFWDGIQMVKLAEDMKTPVSTPYTIARRVSKPLTLKDVDNPEAFTIEGGDTIEAGDNAIEGPFIIKNGEWYYLFVSWDYCCRGRNSTYKTVYGRSKTVEGPYLDKEGKDMANGGGTYLVGPCDDFYGIGHCSAYNFDGQWWFVSHAYDVKKNGEAKLYLRKFNFDEDGWIKLSEE